MAAPERVVFDTAALYALISARDEFHIKARALYEDLLIETQALWITSYVFVEFGALVHRRFGFEALRTFLESIDGVIATLWIDENIHLDAWTQLNQRDGKGLNFVDWTTFLAAQRLGAHIFTFDGGFRDEGAEVIP